MHAIFASIIHKYNNWRQWSAEGRPGLCRPLSGSTPIQLVRLKAMLTENFKVYTAPCNEHQIWSVYSHDSVNWNFVMTTPSAAQHMPRESVIISVNYTRRQTTHNRYLIIVPKCNYRFERSISYFINTRRKILRDSFVKIVWSALMWGILTHAMNVSYFNTKRAESTFMFAFQEADMQRVWKWSRGTCV